jgi:hypothetical protein
MRSKESYHLEKKLNSKKITNKRNEDNILIILILEEPVNLSKALIPIEVEVDLLEEVEEIEIFIIELYIMINKILNNLYKYILRIKICEIHNILRF